MAAKIVLALCAQVFLVQYAHSQNGAAIGAPWGIPGAGWNGLVPGLAAPGLAAPGLAAPGLGAPYGPGCGCGGVASTGGGFPVTSVSPIAPTGISIFSENAIEGPLAVGGNLPFLGTVAVEGILPTAGSGAVSYGCGNGAVGIVSEGPIATGIVGPGTYAPAGPGYGPAAYGPGIAGPGYNGLPGYGCGCGAIY